jgi:HSP20 family protein
MSNELLERKSTFPSIKDFFGDDFFKTNFSFTDWSPAVNVSEDDSHFEIEVAAPGIKKDEFELSIENGVLQVSGKNEKEEEENKKNYTRKEFSSRSFSKYLTLPENVDKDSIQAKHKDGVLSISFAKTAQSTEKKRIQID